MTAKRKENGIWSTCAIVDNKVWVDGKPVFSGQPGPVDDFLESVYTFSQIKYPKFHKMDALSRLGLLATEWLLHGKDLSAYSPEDIGVVLSNASASLDSDIKYYRSVAEIPSPALFVYTLPNIMIGEICIRHRIKGENGFFVSPRFDAGFMAGYVNNLINNNILQCCICGWVELLNNRYEAMLYLVANSSSLPAGSLLFDEQTIAHLYESTHG